MKVSAENLTELVRRILGSAGVSAEEAKLVSDSLVESNLVGHDSHGVIRVPGYIKAIHEGRVNIRAKPHVVKENPGNLVIDGDWGFGPAAAAKAMKMAIQKARREGVACASVFNCNDVGRLGAYSTIAAEDGCIGVVTVNDGGANSCVAPWGGRSRVMSTNPLSVAVPMRQQPHICVDIATSVVAGGKIAVARKRREELPAGCLLNAAGEPSTDPDDFFVPPLGALLPFGGPVAGHKGFALSLVVDILSGALGGAGCSGSAKRDAQGVFMLAIDIAAFTPMEEFFGRTERLVETIKSSPKAEGVAEILIPGEPEWREREKRLAGGIFIEEATWQDIMKTAGELGVEGGQR